jgi:MFS family permease
MLLMIVSGGAWIIFISVANVLAQTLAPDWVRARVLAIFMLVTQGGLAAGSALWGLVGSHSGVDTALLWAGLSTMATTALGLIARLPDSTADMSPWNHWRMPAVVRDAEPGLQQGPVLVTVEYRVEPRHTKAFLDAMHQYGHVRQRDGAFRWGVFRDVEHADVYLETFLLISWAEHLRQHERLTRGDGELEQRIGSHAVGEPKVRHLIHPGSGD